ncbi:MAG TPA: EAL domain-containing protein [Rhodocyclaceae bacterium]|nr:EAL domain-containing protein [Rhodocyclaceae bacterium]
MAREIKPQIDALWASADRFRSLLNLSTDWYWEQDAEFRYTYYQANRLDISYDDTFLMGKRRWELPTTLSEAEWAAHRALLEAHESFRDLEYGMAMPDGDIRYFAIHGEPVFGPDGEFAGYHGTSSDITERKRAEASLRLAASVFDQASEGIIITDSQWRIVDCNPTISQWTGFEHDELLGRDLRQHFADSGGDLDLMETALWALAENGYWRGETRARRKNGEHLQEMLTATAVVDESGVTSHYTFIFSDITALKEHQQRLEYLAHYDPLTRLPNRVLLGDRIQQALNQAQRSGEVVAVAYLDLDGFKPINDNLGHAAGDLLLVEVARRLRACVRSADTVARLGGDEFVLIIKAQDFGDCEAATLRVLATLSAPYAIDGIEIELSASIGLTLYPNDGADPDVLLRHADQAMYVAKQGGRNRYHLFDSEHDRQLSAHRERLSRIETALSAGELLLFYQPKVDMRRGKVIGAEALLRWKHPDEGLMSPAEFLPLVEETDFSIVLGEWVIATALAQMRTWQLAGLELPVSVNISAKQLQSDGFVDRLQTFLSAQPQVPPQWLELEILETAALDDIHYVGQVIKRCQSLGLSFALDDFGTGYSSLAYFKRLPARLLKIDQSFIRDMLEDPEDLAIVDGVISLARAFRREVIAEGVETVEHGLRLLEMGCHLAQGYGIARPMPAESIPAWVRDYRPDHRWLSFSAS